LATVTGYACDATGSTVAIHAAGAGASTSAGISTVTGAAACEQHGGRQCGEPQQTGATSE
jgi:hypothetical protein